MNTIAFWLDTLGAISNVFSMVIFYACYRLYRKMGLGKIAYIEMVFTVSRAVLMSKNVATLYTWSLLVPFFAFVGYFGYYWSIATSLLYFVFIYGLSLWRKRIYAQIGAI